jgi:hypothetical protein
MTGIDFIKPGAQALINSWADECASWGVHYINNASNWGRQFSPS